MTDNGTGNYLVPLSFGNGLLSSCKQSGHLGVLLPAYVEDVLYRLFNFVTYSLDILLGFQEEFLETTKVMLSPVS